LAGEADMIECVGVVDEQMMGGLQEPRKRALCSGADANLEGLPVFGPMIECGQ
jgi:hypothetical protein